MTKWLDTIFTVEGLIKHAISGVSNGTVLYAFSKKNEGPVMQLKLKDIMTNIS